MLETSPLLNYPQLESLYITNNHITTIQDNSFRNFNKLTNLHLSDNQLTRLTEFAFHGAAKLTALHLKNNRIKEIDTNTFSTLQCLQRLDLTFNQIESIDENLFVNNDRLILLYLEHNPLKSFSSSAFFSSEWLPLVPYFPSDEIQILDLSCKQSCEIREEIIHSEYPKIIHFNASGVEPANITEILTKLNTNLESLDLSNSSIRTLNNSFPLKKFEKLQTIILTNAGISKIKADAFSCQESLLLLDLSDNKLKDIAPLSESGPFNALEELNLNGNRLQTIDTIIPAKFPKLKALAISGNNFTCEYLDTYFNQWKGYYAGNATQLMLMEDGKYFTSEIQNTDCHRAKQLTSDRNSNTNEGDRRRRRRRQRRRNRH